MNKENVQHPEQTPAKPKSVQISSQDGFNEENLVEREKSSSSSVQDEFNKENEQHQEQNPTKPKKSVRISSQVGVNEKRLVKREIVNNIHNIRKKWSTAALSSKKQASPGDGEKKITSVDKGKKDASTPKFKRKVSCLSLSQPIYGDNFDSGTPNWKMEYKKQVQIAKKMRLKADRANKKLYFVKSELKKLYEFLK